MDKIDLLASRLIFRVKSEWRQPVERAWFAVLIFLLIAVMALSLPPVINYLYANGLKSSIGWLNLHKLLISEWLTSLRLIFEICAAIFVGGTIFAKSRATKLESQLQDFERSMALKAESEMNEAERQIAERFRQVQARFMKPKKTLMDYFALIYASIGINLLIYRTVRHSNQAPINALILTSFPGGLYGMLAFLFLLLVCVCKLAQSYIAALGSNRGHRLHKNRGHG